MSEATRSAALMHAVATHGADGHEAVLKAAKAFDAFISGAGAAEDKPAATTKSTTKPATTGKPATKKPAADADEEATVTKATKRAAAAAEAEDAGEGEGSDGDDGEATLEAVETVIADLLGANKRKQAVSLLAEYGAKSASGVKAGDRAAFLEAAQDLLLGA